MKVNCSRSGCGAFCGCHIAAEEPLVLDPPVFYVREQLVDIDTHVEHDSAMPLLDPLLSVKPCTLQGKISHIK
jgi:hypothetical protein